MTMNSQNPEMAKTLPATDEKKFKLSRVVVLLAIFVLGYFAGKFHSNALVPKELSAEKQSFSLFWEAWNMLDNRYPFEEPSVQDKIFGAIRGLTEAYNDDYTTFFNPSEASYFNDNVTGEFGGIGAEIGVVKGFLVVVSPLQNSPAAKAGLQAGDLIMNVDGTEVSGMSLDEAINLIRGDIGTTVELGIIRRGSSETETVSVTRELVNIPILEYEQREDVFVVQLFNFNEDAGVEFEKAMEAFAASDANKLVLDLRNNPGGYLNASIDIASYFLPQGEIVVTEDYGNSETKPDVFRSFGHETLSQKEFTTAVIINYGSASASEILAAALQDHGVAKVYGETSYGKGSVQELIDMPEATAIKVTVAKWLTPKGTHIDKEGITPDVEILEPKSETDSVEDALYDSVLEQTINYLKQN
jgi:carboxyl-terminal processing protease